MSDRPTVLLPIKILEGPSMPEGVPTLLSRSHIILLGYHVVPDQTPTEQAELQFEDRASDRLDDLEQLLVEAGATVERRLVFTHQAQQTLDRIITEHDCDAVLVPNTVAELDEVFVPVAGVVGMDRIATVVAGMFDPSVSVTLYHMHPADGTEEDAQRFLEGVADRLVDLGMDEAHIDLRIEAGADPLEAITDAATEYDVVVMGESDPSIATFVFGMPATQVAQAFLGPVIVVQRAVPEEAD